MKVKTYALKSIFIILDSTSLLKDCNFDLLITENTRNALGIYNNFKHIDTFEKLCNSYKNDASLFSKIDSLATKYFSHLDKICHICI